MDPQIVVRDPAGDIIAQVTGNDRFAVINSIPVETAGNYEFEVGNPSELAGSFSGNLLLNGAFELEGVGGGDNNTIATAQNLDGDATTFGRANRIAVTGELQNSQGTPLFTENFDSGNFGPNWTSSSSNEFGRIEINGDNGTAAGAAALLMDSNNSGNFVNNEAIWTVDLSGQAQASLGFFHTEFSDEADLLPNTFTGSVDGDGVSISDDGVTWHTILNAPSTSSGDWEYELFDLASLASQFGLTLGANFQVKFQQYDNFELPTDGRGYDEIEILTPDTTGSDWYSFSLKDGEHATINFSSEGLTGTQTAGLYDSSGMLLQSGTVGENVFSHIEFTDSTTNRSADTYYVQVSGSDRDYSMLVTRNAVFDLEPNNNPQEAIDITGLGGAFGFVSRQSTQTAEPDDFMPTEIINNAFDGVTLSNGLTGDVFAVLATTYSAPTGTIIFGNGPTDQAGWGSNDFFRADFDAPVSTVSIDVGSDDSSDVGVLMAYNANGALLESVTSGSVSSGNSETLTITRSSSDIAYIIASGVGGDITPLDNLVFSTPGSSDWFSIDARAGKEIDLEGVIPGLGPYFLDNGLDNNGVSDLTLSLFDPNGAFVAFGTESLTYEATIDGTYMIAVDTNGGAGEYFLQNNTRIGRATDTIIFPQGISNNLNSGGSPSTLNATSTTPSSLAPTLAGSYQTARTDVDRAFEELTVQESDSQFELDADRDFAFQLFNENKFGI